MMESTVAEIFEKHSVDEIRRMCMKIRNDVESKKMELRFLVGERHRDVIEASDNILLMKDFSYSIINKLSELESCCCYNPTHSLHNKFTRQHNRNPKKLIASQLKLLLDIPEMIWSALDSMDYTGAVEFFLLGRHLSVKMQLSGETMAAHVNARVLVKRQWAALDHVESTIASACRKQVALSTVSDEILAQALTALLVLEDQTMHTALEEFLSGRSTALNCILGVDGALSSSGQPSSFSKITVEERLSLVVDLLTQTAQTVATLFLPNGQISCLLQKMAKWCPRETAWFSGENLFEHLPDNVVQYHITLAPTQSRHPKSPPYSASPLESPEGSSEASLSGIRAVAMENDILMGHFKTWWQATLNFCQKHLFVVLSSHLLDLGDLVETRRVLLNKLSACSSSEYAPGHRVDLWTDLFQSPFLKHFEVLLKSALGNVFTEFETSLLSLVKAMNETDSSYAQPVSVAVDERDLMSFVWSQSLASSSQTTSTQSQDGCGDQISDIPLDQLLDVSSKDLVFVYFACLVGRRDLLPSTNSSRSNDPCNVTEKDELDLHQLPGPLRWRLGRLLESAAFTYSAFDCRGGIQRDGEGGEETIVSACRQELNRKRKLVTPRLREICSSFNNHVCEIVATAASEDVATWRVLLSTIEDLITRFYNMAQRLSDEEKSNNTGQGIFYVARACFCLLDIYPALGATIVTATAKLLAEEGRGTPFSPWSDVAKLRQAWLNTSRPLRSIAARLSLTAVLRTTVESPVLDELFNTLSSILQGSKNGCGSGDAKLVSITSQWTEIKLNPTTESDLPSGGVSLKVPSNPSWPLQKALLSLSRNLINLSVHVLPRGTLSEEFGLRLANSFLLIYHRLVQAEMFSQSQAFQLLFDVRFIFRLLVSPLVSAERRPNPTSDPITLEAVSGMGHDLLKRLEGAVDPFDLEMSSERLNASIGQAVKSTASLYASLLPLHSTTNSADENLGKTDELSNLTFLPLIPTSKFLEGKEKTVNIGVGDSKIPVFGLLPFSLSRVRPPPQVFQGVKAISQPPVQDKPNDQTSSRNSTADFSWFSGLSFT